MPPLFSQKTRCNVPLLAFFVPPGYNNPEVIHMNKVNTMIKLLRTEKGINQEQLAEQLHVTRQAVSNWETGVSQT